MRALLFLIPLAAHAAAAPCDPVCDPQTKASVSVVSCDPRPGAAKIRVQTVNGSPLRVRTLETSSARSSSPAIVSVGHGASCSAQASTSAGGACTIQTTLPHSVAVVRGEPRVVELGSDDESLAGLAQIVRGARPGAEIRVLDDEAREEIRAAIEEAREAQREAAEDAREALREAREAQREAADEVREALREAEGTRRDALREAELEVRRHLDEVRATNPRAFGGDTDYEALAREALESARVTLDEVDFEAALAPLAELEAYSRAGTPAAVEGGAQGLEERIRELERIAQGQGHDTAGGSLEERVAALERALGARKPSVWRARTPRAPAAPTPAPEAREFMPRGYVLYGDGQLGPVRAPRAAVAPVPPVPAVPSVAPVAPVAPVPPVAPRSGGRRSFATSPAPAAPSTRPESRGDERRAIEDAMQALRSEAEALRAEMQRMREQIDSLPRNERR